MDAPTTRQFYGTLTAGETSFGEHFCELTVDPHAPRDMHVTVHLARSDEFVEAEPTHVLGPGLRIGTLEGMSMTSGNDGTRCTMRVASVEEEMFAFDASSAAVYRYGYRFPLTTTTQWGGRTMQHGNLGYFRGPTEMLGDRVAVSPVPPVCVVIDGVDVEVRSCVNFRTSGSARYPETALVSESLLTFTLPCSETGEAPTDTARAVADVVLQLLSVIERDRVHWTRETVFGQSASGDPVRQVQTTRWVPATRSRERLGWPHEQSAYTGALVRLVAAYERLDAEARRGVTRTCDEFQTASTAGDLETMLIRWHSVVDFYCKRTGLDKVRPAKRRIVETCERLGVRLDDLVPSDELLEPQTGAFGFTHLRNGFVHEGFDVFDGRGAELLEAINTARALGERMLLATLGIDETVGHVGTTGGPH